MSADAAVPRSSPVDLAGDGSWLELPAPPRHGHTAVIDSKRHRIVVLSGFGWTALNQVWEHPLDLQSQWRPLDVRGDSPSPRSTQPPSTIRNAIARSFGRLRRQHRVQRSLGAATERCAAVAAVVFSRSGPDGPLLARGHLRCAPRSHDRLRRHGPDERAERHLGPGPREVGRTGSISLPAALPRRLVCMPARSTMECGRGCFSWAVMPGPLSIPPKPSGRLISPERRRGRGCRRWVRDRNRAKRPRASSMSPASVPYSTTEKPTRSVRALTLTEPMTWSVLDPGGRAPQRARRARRAPRSGGAAHVGLRRGLWDHAEGGYPDPCARRVVGLDPGPCRRRGEPSHGAYGDPRLTPRPDGRLLRCRELGTGRRRPTAGPPSVDPGLRTRRYVDAPRARGPVPAVPRFPHGGSTTRCAIG